MNLEPEEISVVLFSENAEVPTKAHEEDAGFDLYSPVNFKVMPQSKTKINLEFGLSIPKGFYGQMKDRSSLANKDLHVLGGVIDSGYQGPVQLILWNLGHEARRFDVGDKVAQLVILPVPSMTMKQVDSFDTTTQRGTGGFGSTGT